VTQKPDVVVHTCNFSIWEAKAGASFRPVWATQQDLIKIMVIIMARAVAQQKEEGCSENQSCV
jgi:hypothetical protein